MSSVGAFSRQHFSKRKVDQKGFLPEVSAADDFRKVSVEVAA